MKPYGWLPALLLALTVINYPNPFNPRAGELATFECTPDATQEARLIVYDLAARLVLRHPLNLQGGVKNRFVWNGYDNDNELIGSGVYLYRLMAGSVTLGKGKVWVINR
ncbi:MAG: hypothetical protein JW873_02170 [Candidatus Saganbacteria bacterium]|nr:hypothetical protein [Candidatus Saganbacteria bacterium]